MRPVSLKKFFDLQWRTLSRRKMGDSDSMVISKAFVNCGPTYKRVRARSMGRANAIQKRTSHITVVVAAPSIQDKKQ
jgi:large subunit ribosomal protein L22